MSQRHKAQENRPTANREFNNVVLGPVLTGTATMGQTLTCTDPTFSGGNGTNSFTRQWYRGSTAIAGATANTYLLAAPVSAGQRVSCVVTINNTRHASKFMITPSRLVA